MFLRVFAVVSVIAALGLAPLGASAQQMPPAPDGTSVNEVPAAGAQAASDACGNTAQDAFGTTSPDGTPQAVNYADPKDTAAAQQRQNLSSVDGIVLHTAGNLVLVRVPLEPAAGTDSSAPNKSMAVIRLPDGCAPAVPDGARLEAVGTPSTEGILNAERVQIAE